MTNQSPAEALRQQIRQACMVNIGREVEAKVCSISQKQTDKVMELVTAYAATVEREALEYARAAVIASPVHISGQHIGDFPGGMPHVLDRQIDTYGPNKLPVYATTYAMRDFALSKIDARLAALQGPQKQ